MKKYLLLFILLFTITISSDAKQKKLKKSDLIAASIANSMLDKNLLFFITNVMSDMGTQSYAEGLKATLIDGKFTCNFPFQGNSNISTYGSQDLYIKANNAPVDVISEFNDKQNFYRLSFSFKSEYDNELFETIIKVFTTGKTTIEIYSSKRSNMRYSGGIYVKI